MPTRTRTTGALLAIDWPEVLTWDHDQVLRYALAAELLDRLVADCHGTVTVLDVGCNVLARWRHLLDPNRVRVVRADVEPVGGDDFVLLERGRPLPFAKGEFDAVVALEVLEHMPAASRGGFVADCFRVSRCGAIWTCPEGRPDVARAEAVAAAAFAARHGREHPFLEEHAEFGPPTRRELTKALQDLDAPFALFANAPLSRWLAAMLLSETLHERAVPLAVRARLNERLGLAYPAGEPPYRLVAVAARTFAATDALAPLPAGSPGVLLDAAGPAADDPVPAGLNLLATLLGEVGAVAEPVRARAETAERDLARTRDDLAAATARAEEAEALADQTRLAADQERAIATNFTAGVAGSWSWRLLAPLRRLRTWLVPRRYDASRLLPLQQIGRLDDAAPVFQVLGDDPRLLLPCTLPAGWLRIDYRLHADRATHLEVFADLGDGFHADTRLHREAVEGTAERTCFVHLARPARALRLDPAEAPCRVRLERFDVRTVTPAEALGRALGGKLGLLWKYRCLGPALLRGLALLARGRVGTFVRKLYAGLDGNVNDTPEHYSHEDAYAAWVENRRLTDADRERLRAEAERMADPPVISVLVPTYNTPADLLRKCLDSVLRQTYPHWQLCVADDGSTAPHVRPILAEYAARDGRVSLVFRETTGNISAATNSALALATGDYVALLDHDDELAEHALSRVAATLAADRALDMVYSDEDKLEPDGRRSDPFFKPDWSPEYFLACMYTCHLGVYRTKLAREIGGFRSAFDSAQDYDFVLRFTSRTDRIAHVPDVLYHWRKTPTSTASGGDAKPQAHDTAANALRAWLAETGRDGTVEPTEMAGFHRVRFAIRGTPKVSVVIPSGTKRATLHGRETWFVARCVESLREQTTYPNVEVVVLYNDAIDPDLERLLRGLDARLVNYRQAGPFNLADKMNRGAAEATGGQLVFMNDDIEVLTPDWVEAMLEHAQRPEIGAVGAKLLFPNGRLQHGGVLIPGGCPTHAFYAYPGQYPGYFNSQRVVRNWVAVTGACMMTRAELFRAVGGFDVSFPLNYNDVDYCLRVGERGLRSVCTPYARLVHHESVTKDGFFPVELEAFQKRWGARLPFDPYYNANFDQGGHDFRIDPRRPI